MGFRQHENQEVERVEKVMTKAQILTIGLILVIGTIIIVSVTGPEFLTERNQETKEQPLIQVNQCPETKECPDCICRTEATCTTQPSFVQGCHLPQELYNKQQWQTREYTGLSNLPTIFMGNELTTIKTKENSKLYPGCFYGYTTEQEEIIVHRLLGVYSTYLVFKGDNNQGMEKVQREQLRFLVTGIKFK